jgi:hypothetical protein
MGRMVWLQVGANDHLTASLQDYGILLRENDGTLGIAPYMKDVVHRMKKVFKKDSSVKTLDYLQSLADRDNSNKRNSKTRKTTYPASIGSIYIEKGEFTMGDSYKAGQAGAMGPHAQAHDMTFNQVQYQLPSSIDLTQLAIELSQLRQQMKKEAVEPDHDIAVSDIARAEQAAKAGDRSKIVEHLKGAGKWALDVATKIGTSLAVEAIKSASGLAHH